VRFDCQTCGACCCNPAENRAERYLDYVEVGTRSALARQPELSRRFTVLNARGERHMKLVGKEQRCAALAGELGRSVSCRIYQLRPAGCRQVEEGSKMCLQYRRERGIT
jgi:Fe-S-cluster containining protein